MTAQEIEDYLSTTTYKPGWRFYVYRDGLDGILNIRHTQPDRMDPSKQIELTCSVKVTAESVNAVRDPKAFLNMVVREAIVNAETHEVDEWLMVGGHHLNEAHRS